MKKTLILTALMGSTLLFAKPTLTPEVKALLSEVKTDVEGVTGTELKKLIKEDKVILIDVRNPNEWEKDRIEAQRSVQISRGFLEIKYPKLILSKYKKDDAFVVYCAIEPRAVLATKRLKDLGFTNVKYLKGGLANWSK